MTPGPRFPSCLSVQRQSDLSLGKVICETSWSGVPWGRAWAHPTVVPRDEALEEHKVYSLSALPTLPL